MDEKPLSGLWRNDTETPEGKLRAYAENAERMGFYAGYVADLYELADSFEQYRIVHGSGDPDRGRHRKDDPATIKEMQGGQGS
jgi:hypothetical protein